MSRSNKIKSFFRHLVGGDPRTTKEDEDWEVLAAREQKRFPFDTLVAATRDFSPLHKLGEGGFGPVYRGRLEDGREIAVKRLSQSSKQGKKEFTNEARFLARVQHRNIVNLLGYCAHGSEKLLVYEYIPKESLDKILFRGDGGGRAELDWKRRYDVILGVARGLLYLHEDSHDCIIHRDIKAGNVLLDDKWVPKIADFGMARLFPEDQGPVHTRVVGTNGYMAPEYVMHGQLTKAADVYSFGVLVLEVIAGRRNNSRSGSGENESPNLLDWAYKMYKKGKALEIVDTLVASSAVPEQADMCIQIGLWCVQLNPQLRPSMHRVVLLLSRKPVPLNEPIDRPGIPGRTRYRSHRHHSSSSSDCTSGTLTRTTLGSKLSTGTASGSATASSSMYN